jgi:hypothetical protein
MLEADLDASPRTLRFFIDGREQPLLVTHIPQSINFAVGVSCAPTLHFLADFVLS